MNTVLKHRQSFMCMQCNTSIEWYKMKQSVWPVQSLSRMKWRVGRVARFSKQNPPNCCSKLAQSSFERGSMVKIALRGVKYIFFGWVSPVKFTFQGLNITLLRALQSTDMKTTRGNIVKGTLHFFLEIGSFYNSPRVKKLSFTVFESIQPISGSGGSTFSLA